MRPKGRFGERGRHSVVVRESTYGAESVKLERKISKIKRYYLKGFGNLITGITGTMYLSLIEPDSRAENTKRILESLGIVTDFYKKIPFRELRNDKDFRPLFKVRNLLPKFSRKVHSFLRNPEKKLLDDTVKMGTEMTLKFGSMRILR